MLAVYMSMCFVNLHAQMYVTDLQCFELPKATRVLFCDLKVHFFLETMLPILA